MILFSVPKQTPVTEQEPVLVLVTLALVARNATIAATRQTITATTHMELTVMTLNGVHQKTNVTEPEAVILQIQHVKIAVAVWNQKIFVIALVRVIPESSVKNVLFM
jgi:hypothetical protein